MFYICAKSDAIYYKRKHNCEAKRKFLRQIMHVVCYLMEISFNMLKRSSSNSSSGQEYEKKKFIKLLRKMVRVNIYLLAENVELIACEK